MNETEFKVIVTHKKPMPAAATDVLAQRFYAWCYSQGCEIGVSVEIVEPETQGEAKAAA